MANQSDMLRGHTETIILRILLDGDNYGYEISRSIAERGRGHVDVKDATIYTAFRRMESDGLISTYWNDGNAGARRRYYSITEKGKEEYRKNREEWEFMKSVLDALIIGEE